MHRIHLIPRGGQGQKPPTMTRAAATEKAMKDAPTKRAKEEAERMGSALAYHKKKEAVYK
jgi:hypothetical protein